MTFCHEFFPTAIIGVWDFLFLTSYLLFRRDIALQIKDLSSLLDARDILVQIKEMYGARPIAQAFVPSSRINGNDLHLLPGKIIFFLRQFVSTVARALYANSDEFSLIALQDLIRRDIAL